MATLKKGCKGPIRLELERRLIEKSADFSRLASSLPELVKCSFAAPSRSDAGRLQRLMESLKCVMDEATELTNLLGPPLSVMSGTERRQTLAAAEAGWLAAGLSPHETVENLRIAEQKTRGRRATKRHLGLIALDMWLTNPNLSWPRVVRQVCNCGKQTHGPACQEQLRQQVNDLRAALRALGITEPTRH